MSRLKQLEKECYATLLTHAEVENKIHHIKDKAVEIITDLEDTIAHLESVIVELQQEIDDLVDTPF
jgi:hypothetical protein